MYYTKIFAASNDHDLQKDMNQFHRDVFCWIGAKMEGIIEANGLPDLQFDIQKVQYVHQVLNEPPYEWFSALVIYEVGWMVYHYLMEKESEESEG